MKGFFLATGLLLAWLATAGAQTWQEWLNKGNESMQGARFEEAIQFYDKGLQIKPKNPELLGNRGKCYSNLKRYEEALKDFTLAIERQLIEDGYWETPEICFFYFEKGFAYDQLGRHAEAMPFYEKVIALDKTYPYAHNNLAWILCSSPDASLRNPKKALELVKVELDRTEWKDAASLDTLATAQAAAGLFDEAIETMGKAMSLPNLSDEEKKEFQDHLECFQKKQPFVQEKKAAPPKEEKAPGKNLL